VFGFELNLPEASTIYGFEAQVEAVFGDFSLDAGLGVMESEIGALLSRPIRAQSSFTPCNPETRVPQALSCINLEGRMSKPTRQSSPSIVGMQYVFTSAGRRHADAAS
jgi:iron complex outermembrane receptor protein